MDTIKEALTFDDVLLLQSIQMFYPRSTNIFLQLTKKNFFKSSFFTSAMDTVTESQKWLLL